MTRQHIHRETLHVSPGHLRLRAAAYSRLVPVGQQCLRRWTRSVIITCQLRDSNLPNTEAPQNTRCALTLITLFICVIFRSTIPSSVPLPATSVLFPLLHIAQAKEGPSFILLKHSPGHYHVSQIVK